MANVVQYTTKIFVQREGVIARVQVRYVIIYFLAQYYSLMMIIFLRSMIIFLDYHQFQLSACFRDLCLPFSIVNVFDL